MCWLLFSANIFAMTPDPSHQKSELLIMQNIHLELGASNPIGPSPAHFNLAFRYAKQELQYRAESFPIGPGYIIGLDHSFGSQTTRLGIAATTETVLSGFMAGALLKHQAGKFYGGIQVGFDFGGTLPFGFYFRQSYMILDPNPWHADFGIRVILHKKKESRPLINLKRNWYE